MGKTIDINKKKDHRDAILDTIAYLEEVHEELNTRMINIACLDKWKAWSESKEIGSVVEFSDEALSDTQDPNVDILYKLYEETKVALSALRNRV